MRWNTNIWNISITSGSKFRMFCLWGWSYIHSSLQSPYWEQYWYLAAATCWYQPCRHRGWQCTAVTWTCMTSLLRTVENIQGGRLWYWPTPGNLTAGHSNVHIIDRTGSSLLGEIISQQENFSYFFEPLHSLRGDFRWTNQVAPNTEYVRDFVRSLLDCDTRGIRKFTKDKFIVKKSKNIYCSNNSDVLIKSIRLTWEHVAELVRQNTDLKVIHLVRWQQHSELTRPAAIWMWHSNSGTRGR